MTVSRAAIASIAFLGSHRRRQSFRHVTQSNSPRLVRSRFLQRHDPLESQHREFQHGVNHEYLAVAQPTFFGALFVASFSNARRTTAHCGLIRTLLAINATAVTGFMFVRNISPTVRLARQAVERAAGFTTNLARCHGVSYQGLHGRKLPATGLPK